jgi:hypothetical protein
MTRGPVSQKAIDFALPVALARGFVTFCRQGRGSVSSFVIHAAGYTAVVSVLMSRRLHGTLAEMEAQFAESIARLRLVPPGLCRSRELWACSRHGGLRLFRVMEKGIIELGRDGEPIVSA